MFIFIDWIMTYAGKLEERKEKQTEYGFLTADPNLNLNIPTENHTNFHVMSKHHKKKIKKNRKLRR